MAKNEEKKQPDVGETSNLAAAQPAEATEAAIRPLHDQLVVAVEQLTEMGQRLDALEKRIAEIGEPVVAVLDTAAGAQIEFDPAWLKGLMFRGSKEIEPTGAQNGRKVKRFQPFERKAEADDVLSYRVDGGMVTIILADGSKHVVEQ